MATPVENVNTIRAYWSKLAEFPSSTTGYPAAFFQQYASAYYYAARAMKELISQCGANTFTRTDVFARSSVFEQCLAADQSAERIRNILLHESGPVNASIMLDGDSGARALREIMLDGIYQAGNGGFFSQKDPSGLTSWLNSVSVAAGAAAGVLHGDTNPGAVASLLKIVRDLALPMFWVTFFTNQRSFAILDSRLPTTVWSSNTVSDYSSRVTLKALSAAAAGRVATDLARYAQGTLPTFPTGTGDVPTTPAPPKAWYRRGEVWGLSAIGLVGGAAAAQARK